jgi:Stage II sporulation protein E (SpoIIE)
VTGISAVPATEAKKKPNHGNGQGNGQGHGHGQGGKQKHRNPSQPTRRSPGKQQGGGSDDPVARPSTPAPPSPPPAARPAPGTSAPSAPTGSQPAPTTPVRNPSRRERRQAARRERRREGRQERSRGPARRGSRPETGRTSSETTTRLASDAGGQSAAEPDGPSGGARAPESSHEQGDGSPVTPVTRTVRDIVEVVPNSVKVILTALAALSVLLGVGSLFSTIRARRLERQRRELLQEVGLLQSALLPPVPDTVGALRTSVAYRPAEGAAAGGDFYDALSLPDGRAIFVLGDVAGHGRGALERTAFLRYTLRAYLEAGLEPRVALQIAGRVVDEQLGGEFATVLLAVHDPASGSLTYSCAGHPAPIVVGPSAYEPVLAASSPPLGVGLRTGLRQTTVPLSPGSVACLYTDGLTEARTRDGILGRGRLSDLVDELGREVEAPELLDRVAEEAQLMPDDMAVCLFTPTAGVTAGGFRTELLELSAAELDGPLPRRFLDACGAGEEEAQRALDDAAFLATRFDQVVLHVVFGNRLTVEALPANVESIEAAARRALAS